MFSKFKEKNTTCVELKDVTDPRIMSQIIHYMYFNAVSLSPATVQDILSIANYLQIDSLTAACVQFIKERCVLRRPKDSGDGYGYNLCCGFRIDKRNAVSVYLYTSLMGPWDLHVTAQEFILQHFEQVAVKSKDFCALSRDQISRLISSDKLLVSSEGEVYKAVVSWVAHEPRARASLLPALLQHVHFPLMSMDEVEQSSRSHLVKKNKNLATALEEARTYLAKVNRHCSFSSL